MAKSKKQKALDEELIQECKGYRTRDNKPDGAYIKEYGFFFNINKIKRLIDSGADVNAKNKYGDTPLHWAIDRRNIDLAKFLIDSGADVNAKNQWDNTPLHLAVDGPWSYEWDNIDLVKLLIEACADVNAKNQWDYTPLHSLLREVRRNGYSIAKLLIDSGADVNAEDKNGITPLNRAFSQKMKTLLIEHVAE